ncbi:MAG: exodeoxyribonuclease VII large subunit [Candidatus Omnitrophica bacterium]|nr:exodeoxyribonuclease VII large subunit [Candidatus Omnitrophota bacterium]
MWGNSHPQSRIVFSVSDITRNIRFILEEKFSGVWVEGEVSGFKRHTSGHLYFSLKDESSQIQCVMFRRENQSLSFEMQDGLKAVCLGRVSVYSQRGQYQLYVERIEPKGVGALGLRFEQLKEKLRREGLFDAARKKEIPFLPKTVGIVTSIDGAALRDILHGVDRRFREAHLLIYPVQVQGSGAAASIAGAIEDLNRENAADVLIVGRGGGSLEDLWAFNEEITARAIFNSRIPVISAVGHEVDFTIADFVADLRAATPSAAAEIVLPLKEDLALRIHELKGRTFQVFSAKLKLLRRNLEGLLESRGFGDPLSYFETHAQRLDELARTLKTELGTLLRFKKENLQSLIGKLEALGPLSVLKRGFSVSLKLPKGQLVASSESLKAGDQVKTMLSKGYFISEVKETY